MAKRKSVAVAKRSHPMRELAVNLALYLVLPVALCAAALHWREPIRHALVQVRQGVCALSAPAAGAAAVAPAVVSGDTYLDLEGPVSEESLAPSYAALKAAPDGAVLHLHISSPGGDGFAMLFWLDALDQARATRHVRLVCTAGGIVASAAAIIFEACDERTAAASTVWLFHGVSSMAAGKAGNVADGAKLMRVLDMAVAVRIAPNLGMTPDQYVAWVDRRDNFLTTAELAALDKGLVTK